jgi:hypothetical protein
MRAQQLVGIALGLFAIWLTNLLNMAPPELTAAGSATLGPQNIS